MRKFNKRKAYIKPYKQRFVIVHEGKETEREYIRHLKDLFNLNRVCHIETHSPGHSSIASMISKMEQESDDAQEPDRHWIVLDRDADTHTYRQFIALADWEMQRGNNQVALSNPRFEYWLLLHVEEYPGISNAASDSYIRSRIPNYTKNLTGCKNAFTKETITAAIERANRKEIPQCSCPDIPGTGVGHLVQQMIQQAHVTN